MSTRFHFSSYGESHGPAIGGIIEGMPSGVEVDMDFLQHELDRRRPAQNKLCTQRKENDQLEILSGVFEGKTTGCPIGFLIHNTDQRSSDYEEMKDLFRPSHADYTYQQKYGIRDWRGGGRASARETACRVVVGAFAKLILRQEGISIQAFTQQVGSIALPGTYQDYDLSLSEQHIMRCPDAKTADRMQSLVEEVRSQGDTIGGIIQCVVKGCPIGLGEPIFHKLHADLGAAMLSIPAVKGFEYGMGFEGACRRGSEMNDPFIPDGKGGIRTASNHSGGIQGGISNGEDIYFRVAFKPIATLMQDQQTVDIEGLPIVFKALGRHDSCVLPRAVPVVEAMTAIVLMQHL